MTSHWLPGVERRGLGRSVVSLNHIAILVSDVGRSTSFYTDVLGLQQIKRPNFDRHGAWLTTGNVELHLIKGTPLVHTGENLIVSHIALDVEDPKEAFKLLGKMKIPFEINVSVPKGGGKAESEGGSSSNTLSQAFLRDPDGYYIELCNCDILTDFALGQSGGLTNPFGSKELPSNTNQCGKISLFVIIKMLVHSLRAKKVCKQRKVSSSIKTKPLPLDDQPSDADLSILENFLARKVIYGDICQSFGKTEMETLLRESGNSAPKAQLLMLHRIREGHKRLLFPPAYYIKMEGSNSFKFTPEPTEYPKKYPFDLGNPGHDSLEPVTTEPSITTHLSN